MNLRRKWDTLSKNTRRTALVGVPVLALGTWVVVRHDDWARFFGVVLTAEWSAEVGLPVLATVLSLVGAVLLVRSQIRHSIESTQAQRHSATAQAAGQRLLEAMNWFNGIDPAGPETQCPKWEGQREVFTTAAFLRTHGVPQDPEPLASIEDLTRDILHRWQTLVAEGTKHPQEPQVNKGGALIDQTVEPQELIRTLAKKFIQWDGRGSLPTLTAEDLGPWTKVPLQPYKETRKQYQEWQDQQKKEYLILLKWYGEQDPDA